MRGRIRTLGSGPWAVCLGRAEPAHTWQKAESTGQRTRETGIWNPKSTFILRYELPLPGPNVNLLRPRDLLLGIAKHLFPLREPPCGARNGEEHGEEIFRESHRLVDQARIEIDVRVQLPRHEIFILQRNTLELERD